MGLKAMTLVLILLVAGPTAAAHGAPTPPSWVTRLLHDYNDDWGGHAASRDGHDLIALDLQERYDSARALDTLVFRLYVAGGFKSDASRPTLRDVVTFNTDTGPRSYEFRTSDNEHYEGTFDEIRGPTVVLNIQGQPDGSRRSVEGILFLAAPGNGSSRLHVGDVLRDFTVEGYAGTTAADHMVGGYTEDGVRHDELQEPELSDSLSYRRPNYTLRGPVMYLEGSAPETALTPGVFAWTLRSRVGAEQRVALSFTAPKSVVVTLQGVDGATVVVGAREERTVTVQVNRTGPDAGGPLQLAFQTDLGGHGTTTVQVSDGTGAKGGGSPGPGTVAFLALLVFAALGRRSPRGERRP